MTSLFRKANASEYRTTPDHLPALLQGCRQDLTTGLVQFSHSTEDHLTLFLVEGNIINAYLHTSTTWKHISPTAWGSSVKNVEGTARILNLPIDGIRIGKITVECMPSAHTLTVQTADLEKHLYEWAILPLARVVHIGWSDAEASIVLPGNGDPKRTILFINREQAITGPEAMEKILSWDESHCEVTIYADENGAEACQEYHLHLAFTDSLELILRRYEELAGRSLMYALGHELTTAAQGQGWHILCEGDSVTDQEVFPSLPDAASAYRMLCNLCLAHAETVIGQKLTNTIVRDTVIEVDKSYGEVLKVHPLLLPDEASVVEIGVPTYG